VDATGDELTPPDHPADSREATVRHTAVMSTGTLLSRATGLVRVSVTLAALGLTAVSDTYNAANTTPNIVYELVLGGILTSVFVPLIVERLQGNDDWREATSRFLTLALVVLGGLAVIGMFAAPWIMHLYLAGVSDPAQRAEQIALGTPLLRWFMPQVVFYGVAAIAGGVLTAHRRFAAQMFAPVLNNLTVIATMGVLIATGVEGRSPAELTTAQITLMGLGTTLGIVAMTVALWPSMRRIGFRYRPRFDWGHDSVRSLVRLARWVVLYVGINQLAYLILIRLNGRLGPGSYTAYSQAFIFFSLPHAIVAVSIFTALLPGMAGRWHAGDRDGVVELYSRGIRDTAVAMLPAALGLIVLAGPIVQLLASYGAVQGGQTELLADTLAAFAVGLPFFSAFQLQTRTFYATGDSRTPALVNIVAAVVDLAVAISLAFALDLGVAGLAFGHAASYLAGTVVLTVLLRRRLGSVDGRHVRSTALRASGAAVVSAAAAWATAWAIAELLPVDRLSGRLVQVAAAILTGVLAFAGASFMLRVEEVDEVRKALTTRFRR
jgi:putative peptidoglycan lipid II flippase